MEPEPPPAARPTGRNGATGDTTPAPVPEIPRFRLGLLLWLASLVGAVSVIVLLLPALAEEEALPAPLWLLLVAGIAQNGGLLALATWAGVALAPEVGFRAPIFEAAAARRPLRPELASRLLPGAVAGIPAGLLLVFFTRTAPAEIAQLSERFEVPIVARLLYGGITEEVLLRWGVMTGVTWLLWRFVQKRRGAVRPALVWSAIVASALLFAAGHLPVARHLLGELTPDTLAWVLGANATFGLLFGWLYWRRGLEAAIVAHATTHLVSYLVTRVAG